MQFLLPVLDIVRIIVHLYLLVLVVMVVMSWLIQFNILNTRQRAVYMAMDVLYRLTNPALRPIQRLVPTMGGLDLSPFILGLILILVQNELAVLEIRLATS
jgi:YggT family protein